MVLSARTIVIPLAGALFALAGPAAASDTSPIAGTWIGDAFPDHVLTVEGREPPLTEEGAALYRANLADRQSEQPQFDRTRWCAGPGVPRSMFIPTPFEIIINQRLNGYVNGMYPRQRAVDMSGEPADPLLPQTMGYPVGRWEGDTLVIVSNGLTSDTIVDASGLPHSDDMVLEERLHVAPDGKLHVRFRITDPDIYSAPWETEMTYSRTEGTRVEDDVCPDRIAAGGPAIVPASEARP
jgi:hypothetical protein